MQGIYIALAHLTIKVSFELAPLIASTYSGNLFLHHVNVDNFCLDNLTHMLSCSVAQMLRC